MKLSIVAIATIATLLAGILPPSAVGIDPTTTVIYPTFTTTTATASTTEGEGGESKGFSSCPPPDRKDCPNTPFAVLRDPNNDCEFFDCPPAPDGWVPPGTISTVGTIGNNNGDTITPDQVGCIQCTNEPTDNMVRRGRTCETAINALATRCLDDPAWVAGNKICQNSCYFAGRGYVGDVCCDVSRGDDGDDDDDDDESEAPSSELSAEPSYAPSAEPTGMTDDTTDVSETPSSEPSGVPTMMAADMGDDMGGDMGGNTTDMGGNTTDDDTDMSASNGTDVIVSNSTMDKDMDMDMGNATDDDNSTSTGMSNTTTTDDDDDTATSFNSTGDDDTMTTDNSTFTSPNATNDDEGSNLNSCDATTGEKWCPSTQSCHREWETACPTTMPCAVDADCRVWLGGCGPYGCRCFALGVEEEEPTQCDPNADTEGGGEPCVCAGCVPGRCDDVRAVCLDGVNVCGLEDVVTIGEGGGGFSSGLFFSTGSSLLFSSSSFVGCRAGEELTSIVGLRERKKSPFVLKTRSSAKMAHSSHAILTMDVSSSPALQPTKELLLKRRLLPVLKK
eukprot:CAMPEP_0178711164 /NCGR_PEP_ID=MMETSP0699-20121125/18193_1 /TAXON_ID=265572 /ORGANISM="Extubocellulus spinifer, Strain CCMP396" /LENGTH=560 /DNA_ID=CAMNT_0020359811 /DNA_START=565 /DNA_END=2245 /DNA_ORIENTATION=+